MYAAISLVLIPWRNAAYLTRESVLLPGPSRVFFSSTAGASLWRELFCTAPGQSQLRACPPSSLLIHREPAPLQREQENRREYHPWALLPPAEVTQRLFALRHLAQRVLLIEE